MAKRAEVSTDTSSETRTTKEARSFRLPSALIEAVTRRAHETGLSTTALVLRYLDEGLRRDEHPLIVFRDAAGGRRAALLGSRLDVWQVIETLRNVENSVRDTADYLGISEAHVRACVRYYAFHRDEIDEWTERMHAIAEHEQDAWRREQAVLA